MLDAKQFELDTKPRETYWALDPDIDPGASDFGEWLKTGNGLVAREKGHPSLIKWRPLTLPEQGSIFAALRSGAIDNYGSLLLCCAHGLISIEGLRVETEAVATGRRVKSTTIAMFEQLGAEVADLGHISPSVWLGGLIAETSFRRGD